MGKPLEQFSGGNRSARDKLNAMAGEVNKFKAITGDGLIQVQKTTSGITLKLNMEQLLPRLPKLGAGGVDIKIFEVQSAGTGDGIYNCYEQTLDATEWADTAGDPKFDDKDAVSVEVLNLEEYDPPSDYVAKLSAGDMLAAWQMADDEGNKKWVGIPLEAAGGETRQAYCKTNASTGDTIVCYLDTDGTGEEKTVYFNMIGTSNINECWPHLLDGSPISVYYDSHDSKWRCCHTFGVMSETPYDFEFCQS